MEQTKQRIQRNYNFTKEERRLITDCHDDQENLAINVDPVNGFISVVKIVNRNNGIPTYEVIEELGGRNNPTVTKLLNMLEVKVICKPLLHKTNYFNKNKDKVN